MLFDAGDALEAPNSNVYSISGVVKDFLRRPLDGVSIAGVGEEIFSSGPGGVFLLENLQRESVPLQFSRDGYQTLVMHDCPCG